MSAFRRALARTVAATLGLAVAAVGLSAPTAGATPAPAGSATPATLSREEAARPAATSLATQPPKDAGTGSAISAAAAVGPTVTLSGRGFGHGRGMSQWGARGAAAQGLTTAQILALYYPGTSLTDDLGNPDVRVRLGGLNTLSSTVKHEAGLTLTDGTCTEPLDASSTEQWRVMPTTTGWQVERQGTNFAWLPYPGSCTFAKTAFVSFATNDGTFGTQVQGTTPRREYRGTLRIVRAADSTHVGTAWNEVVNVLPMDQYLWSVVPAEMPGSWNRAAVAAQAVAARSYAAARLGATTPYDVCATTACQYYPGLTSSTPEYPNSTAAVNETSGQVLRYGGAVALAEFGSTNGGQTAAGTKPYQVSKADPYDGYFAEAPDTWSYDCPVSLLTAGWPAFGRFQELALTRDGRGGSYFGGRVTVVVLSGSGTPTAVGGDQFMARLGLRSTYFTAVGSQVGTDALVNGYSDLVARGSTADLYAYPGPQVGGSRQALTSGFAGLEVLAPGDFDGDGNADYLERTAGGTLSLLRGSNAKGPVVGKRLVGTGWQNASLLVTPGDIDADGAPDLLARDKAGVLWLYPGTGTGGLRPRVRLSAGWESLVELEAVGDFDGNGLPDLVGKKANGDLYQFRLTATGAYAGYRKVGSGWTNASQLTGPGDVSGDGKPDLMVKDTKGVLWVYPGNGAGGFTTRTQASSGWSAAILGS